MGYILQHARATTTPRVRKEIQSSKESISFLAKQYGITYNTVKKWKESDAIIDSSCGNKTRRSILSELEEQAICTLRKTTLLSLDDCYIALKDEIPSLTRSNLHRCLQRNNLSRLTDLLPEKEKRERKSFKEYHLGYVHIDIADINLQSGKYYLFVAIERLSKMVYIKLCKDKTLDTTVSFLKATINYFPFKIHRLLTDNGTQFTYKGMNITLRPKNKRHPFKKLCQTNGISHRETKFRHPWTNGQVERFNRTIKESTIKKHHYSSFEEIDKHINLYLNAYNYAKKLKTIKFLTPIEKVVEVYKSTPKLFHRSPFHNGVGLNK